MNPIILYNYTPIRAGENAKQFLEGIESGFYLMADGYQGYSKAKETKRCSLSNNLSENSIRPVTAGRKNWLFSDTPEGAAANSLYLTIVEMAKAYGLDLYEYLKFLFEHKPNKNMTDEELADLAPWNESVKEQCSI